MSHIVQNYIIDMPFTKILKKNQQVSGLNYNYFGIINYCSTQITEEIKLTYSDVSLHVKPDCMTLKCFSYFWS